MFNDYLKLLRFPMANLATGILLIFPPKFLVKIFQI